jgi:hypothetical protein
MASCPVWVDCTDLIRFERQKVMLRGSNDTAPVSAMISSLFDYNHLIRSEIAASKQPVSWLSYDSNGVAEDIPSW